MSSHPTPEHHHAHSHAPGDSLRVAFLLNVVFTLIEIAGGYWTNSVAILSDALHDSGDCFSLGLAWYLQRLSNRRPDARFTYGYRRYSVAGALVTGLVLIVGLVFISVEAVRRLQAPEEVKASGMAVLAVVGMLFNGFAAWKLHGGHSLNEEMASWHLLEDTLGWAAVLAGSLLMMTWDLPIIDPLLSLLIAAFVLVNVVRNLRKVAVVFLQAAPHGFDVDAFSQKLTEIPGVIGSHHTHTWTLDGERHVFSTHLVMGSSCSREVVVAAQREVHRLLRGDRFEHVTVEIELEDEPCAAAHEH